MLHGRIAARCSQSDILVHCAWSLPSPCARLCAPYHCPAASTSVLPVGVSANATVMRYRLSPGVAAVSLPCRRAAAEAAVVGSAAPVSVRLFLVKADFSRWRVWADHTSILVTMATTDDGVRQGRARSRAAGHCCASRAFPRLDVVLEFRSVLGLKGFTDPSVCRARRYPVANLSCDLYIRPVVRSWRSDTRP